MKKWGWSGLGEFFEFFDNNEVQGKSFNTTGVCNRDKHYMVNINQKLKKIVKYSNSI